MIDDAVGSVLDALERLELADNTILMFTSDHADLLGDHGMMLKGPFHYQGLIRVLVHLVGPQGQVRAPKAVIGSAARSIWVPRSSTVPASTRSTACKVAACYP